MAFDSGVGFAFTGRDVSLGKTARGAASSIDMIGSAVDGVGSKLAQNAQNVQSFLQEFSQKQLDRISSGLESIADSSSINQTSLEGMAAAASKTAKPIVASLGLVGAEAKKAKGQIVGLSIGLNVGADAVGNAVKAWKHYGKELRAVGIDSVKTATKFQEVSGVQVEKLGAQVAGLARSWGLTEEQLGDLVPWILEAGKAFGFGAQAIEGMEQVTTALDQSLAKVLLKDGPEAIMRFTKGIYGLALVASKTLGMDFPDALAKSTDLFNRLAGDVNAFQKQFQGLSTEFGPLADQLGLALGDWHTAFELVKNDPAAFAQQMVELAKNLEPPQLQRLKLILGENSEMLRFLIDNADTMDANFADLGGVTAGTDSLKKFADQGFSTGRTMAEVLDMMRERAKLRFMAISKSMWKPYMKSLREGYSESVGWLKKLSSDTEPGGVGFLVNAAAMGMRFGLGGFIRGMFPPGEGDRAMGIIDALGDSIADMLPHLTALGALGFRPQMLAAPFQYALGPLKALAGPLAGFSGLLGGIPGMALKIFGPIGILTLAVGGFTLLSRKWKTDEESRINVFFKKELPIMLLRGISYALTGKDLTKAARKGLFESLGGKELWGMVAKQGVEMFGKGLEIAMEAFTVGTEVMGDIAGKLADGIAGALEKADWAKMGAALTTIMFHLSSAMGKIVATTPKILVGLVKGIATGLTKVNWGAAFKGLKGGLGKGSEEVGKTMEAGFGFENILGAGALVGIPLLLRKFKKVGKEGKSILGGLRKEATKGVPPEMAGLPKCIPTCAGGGAGMVTGGAARGIPAPTMVQKGPMPPPLPGAAKGYPMGAISGPGAVMQPIAKGPGLWGKMKGVGGMQLGGRAMGWRGAMGMGGMGGAMAALPGAAAIMAGEDLGAGGAAMTYGGAAAMGGLPGVGIAAVMLGASGAVKEFRDTWSDAMAEVREEGGDTADQIQVSFGTAMSSISEGVDDMTGGMTEKFRDAAAESYGINKVTGEQISTVWQMVGNRIHYVVGQAFTFFKDNITNTWDEGKKYIGLIGEVAADTFKMVVDFGKSQMDAFFTFGAAIGQKGKAIFLTIFDKVQSVVEKMTLSSMTLFSNVLGPFVKLLGDMPKAAKTAIAAVFPEFAVFDALVSGLGSTIDKELKKKTLEYQISAIDRQNQINVATAKGNQLMSDAAKISTGGFEGIGKAADALQPKLQDMAQTGDRLSKSMLGLAGGTPLALIGAFLPEKEREAYFGWFGAQQTAELGTELRKEWDKLGGKLMQQQQDQTKVLADTQGQMFDAASKEAEVALADMGAMLGEMGVKKKGRQKKILGVAEGALAAMGDAGSAAEAKKVMADAIAKGKNDAEKQAIGSMLMASGSALFQHGAPQVSQQAKVAGTMKKSGLEFTEALMEAQLDATTEAVGKAKGAKKKALGKQKKALQQQIGMLGEAIAPGGPQPLAPSATVTVGGMQFVAPPPPGGAPAAAGPAPSTKYGKLKVEKPVTIYIKSGMLEQPMGKGEMQLMSE